MAVKYTNNAEAIVTGALTSTDTSITVDDASKFPTLAEGDVVYLTLSDLINSTHEIVICTAIVGNTLTVQRGQDNSTALNWDADSTKISCRLTAGLLEYLLENQTVYAREGGTPSFTSIDLGDGTLSWNSTDNTVDLAYDGVTLQVGQEQHFYGKATEAIANGEVVMFDGAEGDHILIAKADATADGFREEWVIGVATQDFANNQFGYVTSFGAVRDLDTSGFTGGDLLYLDVATPGALTNVKPSKPNHEMLLAAVTRSHAEVGTIFVRHSFRSAFNELHDVNITSVADGNLVAYDSATSTWVNTSTPSIDYIDFAPLDPPTDSVPQVTGRVYFNEEYQALTVYNDISGSSLQLGHEDWIRVYNNTGSTIPNGTPLYVTGAQGETPTVAPADATTEEKARVIGIATHNISDASTGVATVRGLVSGIDTSGLTAGQSVHVGADGSLQTAVPTYPYWPVDIGGCLVSDSDNGYIYVRIDQHHFESFRVSGSSYLDGNLTVAGDFVVQGTQTVTNEANLSISNSYIYLNSGDTIGIENTTFVGTGLNDGYFNNHYEGTTTTTYYVRIDGEGTGTGGVDTYEWSKDNFATTEATGVDLDIETLLDNNICFHVNATTGHTLGDVWYGTAAPVNVDTGWFTNYNTGASGIGYTHAGVFLDVSDDYKFKFMSQYGVDPSGAIDTTDASFTLGTVVASSFEGNLAWSDLTSVPTTAAGYGITDVLTDGDFTGSSGFMKTDGAGNYSIDTNTYLTAESDTLDSVTDRGNTTDNGIGVGSVTIDSDILQTKYAVTTSSTTADPLMSFDKTVWHSAKLVVTATNGTDKQVVELLITHDAGDNAYIVEYGSIITNAVLGEFTVATTATDVVLSVTSTDVASTVYIASATLIK